MKTNTEQALNYGIIFADAKLIKAYIIKLGALRNAQIFSDEIALNQQLLRLKDYYYWKRLGQENRQMHMDPTVKIESNYLPY